MARTDKPQTHRKLYENIKVLLHEARNAVARNINVYSKSETLSRKMDMSKGKRVACYRKVGSTTGKKFSSLLSGLPDNKNR